jgi:hypothetical protein
VSFSPLRFAPYLQTCQDVAAKNYELFATSPGIWPWWRFIRLTFENMPRRMLMLQHDLAHRLSRRTGRIIRHRCSQAGELIRATPSSRCRSSFNCEGPTQRTAPNTGGGSGHAFRCRFVLEHHLAPPSLRLVPENSHGFCEASRNDPFSDTHVEPRLPIRILEAE